jgi:hypothetical protein
MSDDRPLDILLLSLFLGPNLLNQQGHLSPFNLLPWFYFVTIFHHFLSLNHLPNMFDVIERFSPDLSPFIPTLRSKRSFLSFSIASCADILLLLHKHLPLQCIQSFPATTTFFSQIWWGECYG